ncbi:protein FRIGIDA-ESSENTIAL 1 isoform X2 [Cucurbita pepo subsp. pepo]|uniref:protein FRIGIDA-ESSENTIAL 1 isoform X2 n=1 Tax=Cucurbita pepo subsp. pepo TaxID=3664 RepID=UPI000C9D50E6|nr:protein FRIGIDA-ESSENTIAL 1 isoform X2 [Cucurbita pepo subsp. pepo]
MRGIFVELGSRGYAQVPRKNVYLVDVCNDMDAKRHDKHLRSDTITTTESSEVKKLSSVGGTESNGNIEFARLSGEPLTKLVEQSHGECTKVESRKCPKDKETEDQELTVGDKDVEALRNNLPKDSGGSIYNSKVPLCNRGIISAKVSNGLSVTVEDSDIGLENHLVGGNLGSTNPERESTQMDLQLENGKNQMASRSAASKKRTRKLSHGADVNIEQKRPAAAICDFYAKGWCIKGSSCSFLHIKDNAIGSDQHSEEHAGAAYLKRQVQPNQGLQYSADASKSPVFHHLPNSSFLKDSSLSLKFGISSERTLPRDFTESKGWDVLHEKNKFLLHQREDSLLSELPDCQKLPSTSFDVSFPLNREGSTARNEQPPEFGPSSGGFAKLSVMEEPANVACPRLLNDYHSPVLRSSLNSNTTLTKGGILSSRFTTSNDSFPFTPSSSASFFGAQKMSIIDGEHRVSMPASSFMRSSPFSPSESDNSLINASMNSSDYKTKYSCDDWEPSEPFRPSFFIPSINTASQYDPFLDSIELPRKVGGCHNVSLDRQGHEEVSPLSTLHRASGNFMVPGSSKPELNDDTSSLSSHNKAEDKNEKAGHVEGTDSLMFEAEIQGSSGIDGCNGSRTREDDHMGLSREKNVPKKMKTDTDGEIKLSNIAFHEKESEAESDRQLGDMDGKHLIDGNVHKESKATRHFRSALIELVKGILRPKWREGHLKKDVHNTVVKKTLDKVLGTLQPFQVPTTVESVKQYLSSSRPKIEKLVEGYVSKYGKS